MNKNDTEMLITALYNFFLFRSPDEEGLQAHSANAMNFSSAQDWGTMLRSFSTSEEFLAKRERFCSENLSLENDTKYLQYLQHVKVDKARQQHLLVSGFPRSGTSAMVSLLNFAPDVFVSSELFLHAPSTTWFADTFTRQAHIEKLTQLAAVQCSNVDSMEYKKVVLQKFFPETELISNFGWDIVLDGSHLLDYCIKKMQFTLENYEKLAFVGDKFPELYAADIVSKLLVNTRLTAVIMIRTPLDMYLSNASIALRDKRFTSSQQHEALFKRNISNTFWTIGQLQQICPERIICVKYEGFFESRERIEKFFQTLSVNTLSLYEKGIEYLMERSKLLSQQRAKKHAQVLGQRKIAFEESDFDEIYKYIQWDMVI